MLDFDPNGFLLPHGPIEADIEILEASFAFNQHRRSIFEEYLAFVEALRNLGIGPFFQWINGSFVTQKARPRDIDVVTFVDFGNSFGKEDILKKNFYASSTLDCYFVISYPEDHPAYDLFRLDLAEWHHLFASTRRDKRTGKVENKGFLQLKF